MQKKYALLSKCDIIGLVGLMAVCMLCFYGKSSNIIMTRLIMNAIVSIACSISLGIVLGGNISFKSLKNLEINKFGIRKTKVLIISKVLTIAICFSSIIMNLLMLS